jgi:hypothetical protein
MPEPTRSSEAVLDAIRALPAEQLHVLLDRLLEVACEPRCAEAQADGVPCSTAGGSCETCARFVAFVASIRDGVILEQPR